MVGIYISYTQEIAQTNILAFLSAAKIYFFLPIAKNNTYFLVEVWKSGEIPAFNL